MQDKKLHVVDSFCYLGDTIGASGGCNLSVIMRVQSVWGKCWELLPILTSCALLITTHRQIYSTYIRPVFLYASECWAPSGNDLLKLEHNNCAMVLVDMYCVSEKTTLVQTFFWKNLVSTTFKHYYDIIDCIGLVMLQGMMAVLKA